MTDETTERKGGTPAVGVFVSAYNDEDAAEQVLDALDRARFQGDFYYEDAAVIRQDAGGKVHIVEPGDMSTGAGAGVGALIGGLLGILGGPAGIALGAGTGAVVGGAIAHGDAGFDNDSLKEIGVALKPGTSALVAITSRAFLKALQKEVSDEETLATVKAIGEGISAALAEGKDVAYGLLITEEGLMATQVAADDKSAQVLRVVVTEEGVAAGAAVVDETGVAAAQVVATDEVVAVRRGVVTEKVVAGEGFVATEEGAVAGGFVATDEGTVAGTAVVIPEESDETENN